jgi:hypothetical protein
MITSMATASTLMMERTGRCSKFAMMSMFIVEPGSNEFSGAKSLSVPSLSG